jgi:hypothetical protein
VRSPAGRIHWLEGQQPEAHAPPADRSAHRLSYTNLSELRSERYARTTQPSEEANVEARTANPRVK